MKRLVELTCGKCSANLTIDGEREYIYCQYCGTKLILDNDNERIYRHIDEAELKRAETEQIIKLKQLELEEKEKERKDKQTKLKIKLSLILSGIGILMFIIGYALGDRSGNPDSPWFMMGFIGLFPIMASFYIWLFSRDDKNK